MNSNIQECLEKLSSLRVAELQSIWAQFGYAHRNQTKSVLQTRIRDEFLKDPLLCNQACALVMKMYANRGQTRSRTCATTRRETTLLWDYSTQGSNQVTSLADVNKTLLPQRASTKPQPIDASRVKLVDLPFYDREATLLTAVALTSSSQSGIQTKSFRFSIPETFLACFSQRETDPLPRYEIQLRMGLLDPSEEQQDDYPKNVRATINGSMINFPPLISVQPRPGQLQTEQKRQSCPVNISRACLPIRNQYQLNIDWQFERTNYFVVVYVVKHLTPQILSDRIKDSNHVHLEETRGMVRKSLQKGAEDDIAMDSLKVSLLCPLSRLVMNTPCRSTNCSHLQCFDLHNFLMMSEKRPTWKCPVCGTASPYSSLVVDRYFSDIITKVNGKAKDIELLPDADFKIVDEKKSQYLSVQDLNLQEPKTMAQPKKGAIDKFSQTHINSSARSATKEQWIPKRPSTPHHSRTSDSSQPEIITLDDELALFTSKSRTPLEIITLDDSSSSETESENEIGANAVSDFAPALNMMNGSLITLDSDSEDDVPVRKSSATTNTETSNVFSFQQKPVIETPETNIFDAKSMGDCLSATEFAIELYSFLKQFEANDLP
ncbi:MIZ zinc finger family protein [Aphelenchoides besseyi]|nr:MIZ zinc finger family protein [Aphelenchoides besseyi]